MRRFGELLEKYIRKEGLTFEGFGKRVGISEPYVSQLVSGARYPGKNLLERICREAGIESELAERTIAFEKSDDPVVRTALAREILRHLHPGETADDDVDDPLLKDIVEIAGRIKNERLRSLLLKQARAVLEQDEEMRGILEDEGKK